MARKTESESRGSGPDGPQDRERSHGPGPMARKTESEAVGPGPMARKTESESVGAGPVASGIHKTDSESSGPTGQSFRVAAAVPCK